MKTTVSTTTDRPNQVLLANETELARGLEVAAVTSPYGGKSAGSLESMLHAADEDSAGFPARPQR